MNLPAELVIASRNKKKLIELRDILAELPVRIRSADEFPNLHDVVEDRDTFEGNAAKKAVETAAVTGLWAVADDSGIEIDALGGKPGVYSARWSGPGANDESNNRKMIAELAGVPDDRRTARYRCCIALADPAGLRFTVEDSWEGVILHEPRGAAGFGYDPYFLIPALGKSVAEIEPALKNRLSHRGKALAKFKAALSAVGRPAN